MIKIPAVAAACGVDNLLEKEVIYLRSSKILELFDPIFNHSIIRRRTRRLQLLGRQGLEAFNGFSSLFPEFIKSLGNMVLFGNLVLSFLLGLMSGKPIPRP